MPPTRSPSARWRRAAIGSLVVLVALAGVAFAVLTGQFAQPAAAVAVFTAPTLVLRAAVAGRIASVAITQGQAVQPDTVLLTIHTDPAPDPSTAALRSRLSEAQAGLAALEDQSAVPIRGEPAETARARLAELRRGQAAAVAERDQLVLAVAATLPAPSANLVVRARVRGYVRAVEAAAGMDTVAGTPIAQLVDCGRAFLIPQDDAANLQPGERVELRIPGLLAFYGIVRSAAGISEPAGRLVIDPTGLKDVAAEACPVGAAATIITERSPSG